MDEPEINRRAGGNTRHEPEGAPERHRPGAILPGGGNPIEEQHDLRALTQHG